MLLGRKKTEAKTDVEVQSNDAIWAKLNKQLLAHARDGDWGLYRNDKFNMAELLAKESRSEAALSTYLDVCYLDLNGPSNVGSITDKQLLKEYPPFSTKQAFLPPGVVFRAAKLIRKLGLEHDAVKSIFNTTCEQSCRALHLPVKPDAAWKQLEKELFK